MGYFAVNKSGTWIPLYYALTDYAEDLQVKGYIQPNERFVVDYINWGEGCCTGRVLHNPDGAGVVDGYFTLISPLCFSKWDDLWSNYGFGTVYSPNVPGTPLSVMNIDKKVACYGSSGELICYLEPGSKAYITPGSVCGETRKNCISAYGVYGAHIL